ncbi:transcription factor JunB [Alligator mississippiensis]|nr:transcription factor JunB [Alligator mississippiensis]
MTLTRVVPGWTHGGWCAVPRTLPAPASLRRSPARPGCYRGEEVVTACNLRGVRSPTPPLSFLRAFRTGSGSASPPGSACPGWMCTKMEQPFYHDDSFLTGYGRAELGSHADYKPYRALKAQLQLRAGAEEGGGAFYAPAGLGEAGSASLKLASPELERLIIQNSNGVVTTTPTPPGQFFYPRGPTEEQEGFADGFVKALDDLHKLNHLPPPNVSLGAAPASSAYAPALHPEPAPVYTTLTSYPPPAAATAYPSANLSYLPPGYPRPQGFKEEPQTVPEPPAPAPGSPPLSPIDMEDQERIKVERKRLRNRLAATKCRKRKLERIARLEEKVKSLKAENAGLSSTAGLLRDQVAQLKQKVLTHVNSGCQLLLAVKMQAF